MTAVQQVEKNQLLIRHSANSGTNLFHTSSLASPCQIFVGLVNRIVR